MNNIGVSISASFNNCSSFIIKLKAEQETGKKWMLPGGVKSLINENVKNARRSGTSVMGHDSSRERAKNIKS